MKRKLIFVCLLFSALFLCFFYISSRLHSSGWFSALLAAIFGLVFLTPVLYWVGDRESKSIFDDLLQQASFIAMGVVSFLFVFTVLRDALLGISLLFSVFPVSVLLENEGPAGVTVLTLLSLLVGGFIAKTGPRVHEVVVPLANLPTELEGLRIVQISDLHIGIMIRKPYIKKVVELTNLQKADFVVMTGDIGDSDIVQFKEDANELQNLLPRGKIFYAPGNHEYYWDPEAWFHFFRGIQIQVLLNANVLLTHQNQKICIAGVVDWAAEQLGQKAPDPELAMRGGEGAGLKILLAHQPKIALRAEQAGFDLQLSGHTHAGQFFPWTWVAKKVHPLFVGLEKLEKMWVYVSPGTGSWGPPIRLGSRTEITLLILRRSS